MIVKYSPSFLTVLKKLHITIRKNFSYRIRLFAKNPYNLELNNHALHREYGGFRSIDITADYRALYEEKQEEQDTVAYFIAIGNHQELYG